ncbi:Alpha-ketoglutarate-dependent taurine dioxygenase (plasmid) [Streptomyces sp. ADI95-16]|nr:Alpha-ketoglutarate-dependent taurine dioxygenase [Streptomyces sp. ADI95-16]
MSTFDIRKIGGRIGAEVTGVDLSAGLSDSVFGQINEAFLEHKVLFFRNQDITDEQQLAFAGRFGPLTRKHPMMRAVDTAAPHVLAVDGEDQRARSLAHRHQLHHRPFARYDAALRGAPAVRRLTP